MSSQLQVSGEAKIRDIQGPVVANSGVITALDGAASQYVRGDGTLADFPTSTGGGSSVSYYLNSSVSQGTIGGVAYRQLSKTPISGAGTDITVSTNGYIASYLTDANDPALLEVPAGNFNCEFYFSVNSNNHNPYVYAELYKYDGTTFTLLGSSQSIPEYLTNGTTLSAYYFAIPVAVAALTITDRLAIRIYANVDGRVVTLHTENNHLCQVVTTFSKGLTSLNNLTRQVQFLATGTSGTNFNIVSSVATHTFNLPIASATNTGKLSSTDWSTFNNKQAALSFTAPLVNTSNTISIPVATSLVDGYLDNLDWTNFNTAYNRSLTSAAVTGTTTKTLTLNQQDGGTITASWTDINTDAVTSVFGRTGAVVATSGDYNTSQVTENTNLYFTDARSRAALSFAAGSGAYNSTTGVITIPTNNNQITNGSNFITLTSLSAGAGISYNNTTGAISSTITQYTDALARAAISLTTTGSSGAATYNSTTGIFNIPNYGSALSGYLPLTGGTLTGALNISNDRVAAPIPFKVDNNLGYGIYLSADNSLNFNFNKNEESDGYINYRGYNDGNTQFRNLYISNGKNLTIAEFKGSSRNTILYGSLLVGYTTDAGFKLDVNGTARVSNFLEIKNNASNISYLTFQRNSNTQAFSLIEGNGENTTGWLKFYTSDTLRLTIAGNGAATFFMPSASNGLSIKGGGNGGTFPFRVTWSGGGEGDMFNIDDDGRARFNNATFPTAGGFTNTTISIKQRADGGSGGGIHIEQNSNTNVAYFGFTGTAFKIGTSYRFAGSSYQPILIDAGSGTSQLFLSTNGNVLIGTDSGVSGGGKLQVNGNVNINGVFQINGTTIGGGGGSGVTGSGTTNYVTKWTGGSTLGNSAMFDNGTSVGLNTNSPLKMLHVYAGNADGIATGKNLTSTYESANIFLYPSSITPKKNWAISAFFTRPTTLQFLYSSTSTSDPYDTGSPMVTFEGASGNVMIGTTTDNGYKLNLNGSISYAYGFLNNFRGSSSPNDILVGNSGSTFYVGGSVTATGGFFDTSDSRLKILVKDYEQPKGIENIAARMYVKNNRKELGYYAQDLQEILPSAVSEGSDGFLTLSYSQVHTAKIAHLEKEIAELKELIKQLL
jgi:hypothetical protein